MLPALSAVQEAGGTLLVFITERCRLNEELWALLEDLLNKVMLGEVNNRLVYFQLPAPPRRFRHSPRAQPKGKQSGNHQHGRKEG